MRGVEIKNVIYLLGVAMVGLAGFFAFSAKAEAATGVNSQISFQGKLVNTDGTNIADGTYNLRFKIYQDGTNSGSGSSLKWTETRQVSASQGVTAAAGTFQVNLGSVTPFGTAVDWNQDTLWLSMEVGGTSGTPAWDGEMTPFIRLTAVPYAQNANTLDGLDSTALAQLATNNAFTGNVSVAGVASATKFSVGNLFTVDTANSRVAIGGTPINYTNSGASGTLSIEPKVDYPTAANPFGVAPGDFDGDGDNDIVTANASGNSVSVLKNNGNATFATKVDYPSGLEPRGVSTGDIDGDGDVDIAVSSLGSNVISILKNNGNATFATKVDYPTGTEPQFVTFADMDGDSDQDLVVTSTASNAVSILLNNGTGTFASKVDYTTGAGSLPEKLAVGDLDNDGDMDVATANFGTSNISVLLNNGNATLAAKVDYPAGTNADGIAIADFNGDGFRDLATANEGAASTSVFINNGNGTFATKVDYATGVSPESIAANDLTGDNIIDLVVVNSNTNTISILVGNGNGTFATKTDYATGTDPEMVSVIDLDSDGDRDIVIANDVSSTISVFKNITVSTPSENSVATASVRAASATSGGLFIKGVAGQTASYFRILNAAGSSLLSLEANGQFKTTGNVELGGGIFSVDTGGSLVRVGPLVADNVATVFILDTKNSSGDPTGDGAVNGAMYYNSFNGKFRCYQSGAWVDCISTIPAPRPVMLVTANASNTTTTFADVPGLTTSVLAGQTYNFTCDLVYTSAATTTALLLSINGPTATNISYSTVTSFATGTDYRTSQTAYNAAGNPATGGGAVRYPATIRGAFTATSDGTFAVRYRSEVAGSAVNIMANSFCKLDS